MRKLETVGRKLEPPLQSAANIFLIAITVIVFVEVVGRYIFGQSHGFMEEFSRWFQVWFTYLMVGVILKGRRHISIDILPRRIPERYKPVLFLVLDIVTLGFAIVLVWSGIASAILWKEIGLTSSSELATPLWVARLCVPLGALFLAFFSIHHLAMNIVSLGKRGGGKE